MSGEIYSLIITLAVFAANMILLFQVFPSRFDLRVSIGVLALFTISELTLELLLISLRFDYGGLRGLLYFPLLLFLLKGTVFQKLFAFSLELVLTVSLSLLISEMVNYLFGDDTILSNVVSLSVLFVILTAYVIIVSKNKRIIYEKLFAYGSKTEWAIYSLVGLVSYGIMAVSRMAQTSRLYFIAIMLFILLSYSILCFAIVNTHEKTKQKMDAAFARSIVSAGRDHYQKMDELYNKLRILRHDYKYHLSTAREMLQSGDAEGAGNYLTGVGDKLTEYELPQYCQNSVVNALVAAYAERCRNSDIRLKVDIGLLKTLSVPDYELCVIIGNLLENAMEASGKLNGNRLIELASQCTSAQMILMVKNRFDGKLSQDAGVPVSNKLNGGIGLQSVRTVAVRFGGDLFTEWDADTFTAYVTVGL